MNKTFIMVMMIITLLAADIYAGSIPAVRAGDTVIEELFRLAIDEVKQNINSRGTFYAGAKWQGVWTRDSAYSIDLSLSLLFPENAKSTLAALLTDDGNIRQDTGTGGGYPVSSDRAVWAMAAYRLALLSKDAEYMRFVYDTVERLMEFDSNVTFDAQTGLFRGETSFLDWREQTYPMSIDFNAIGNSFALSTNVLYYTALMCMADMACILGVSDAEWRIQAESLSDAIRKHFFGGGQLCSYIIDNTGLRYYGGYDTLAVSLAILSGLISGQEGYDILHRVAPSENGMPVVSPQISGIESYHNNGIWPFVQAYRILAAHRVGDFDTVEEEFAVMCRFAQRFGTFYEDYKADDGDPDGTATNSARQLWSDAGFLAVIMRTVCGLSVTDEQITLTPMMVSLCGGSLSLQNVHIGETTLNIQINGIGSRIASVNIDGKAAQHCTIMRDGKTHQVMITMESAPSPWTECHKQWDSLSAVPISPIVSADNDKGRLYLEWKQPGERFDIVLDGNVIGSTSENFYRTKVSAKFAHIAEVRTVTAGLPTVFGSILRIDSRSNTVFCEAEDAALTGGGAFSNRSDANMRPTNAASSADLETLVFNGRGYISHWGRQCGDSMTFSVMIKKAGRYAIDIRYQNGNGPVNTGSGCGIVAVSVDGTIMRRLPLAQRGSWMDWGFSSPVTVALPKGVHTIMLRTDEYCHNDRNAYNPVNVDLIRVARLAE